LGVSASLGKKKKKNVRLVCFHDNQQILPRCFFFFSSKLKSMEPVNVAPSQKEFKLCLSCCFYQLFRVEAKRRTSVRIFLGVKLLQKKIHFLVSNEKVSRACFVTIYIEYSFFNVVFGKIPKDKLFLFWHASRIFQRAKIFENEIATRVDGVG